VWRVVLGSELAVQSVELRLPEALADLTYLPI